MNMIDRYKDELVEKIIEHIANYVHDDHNSESMKRFVIDDLMSNEDDIYVNGYFSYKIYHEDSNTVAKDIRLEFIDTFEYNGHNINNKFLISEIFDIVNTELEDSYIEI